MYPFRGRFSKETGIKFHEWNGKFWARWGDALREVGFEPNALTTACNDSILIEKFIEMIRELGHWLVHAELRIKARNNSGFPAHNTFARLGSKEQMAMKILEYCQSRAGYEDVIALCEPIAARTAEEPQEANEAEAATTIKQGYVYMALIKVGREKRYKIGKAVLVGHRRDQITIQFPEDLELVHSINTDDAYGIEECWHRWFASKHTNGEWFSLSSDDVRAFKRRKCI